MKITHVEAAWLHVPLEAAAQHVSDFGRITAFDAVLVTIRTDAGLVGYGEAKPAVGSAGDASALVTIVKNELAPALVGEDPRDIGGCGRACTTARARRWRSASVARCPCSVDAASTSRR
jgi:L-alanine-DL-glutamate epimerase-like enolase superfamily enzyme